MTPEFSRPVRIDTLGPSPRAMAIGADEAERAALAGRFGLIGIEHLSAEAELSRHDEAVRATGTLQATVTQSCVATGEPVSESVEETFRIEFRPPPAQASADEEVELSEGELDVVFYHGAVVDLGEAVAETLWLALDPYPRAPEAAAVLKQTGVKGEDEVRQPGALAGLKDLLGGKA